MPNTKDDFDAFAAGINGSGDHPKLAEFAMSASPDEHAAVLATSKRIGVPAVVVPDFADTIKHTDFVNTLNGLQKDAEKSHAWVTSKPDNVALAQDSFEQLKKIEGAMKQPNWREFEANQKAKREASGAAWGQQLKNVGGDLEAALHTIAATGFGAERLATRVAITPFTKALAGTILPEDLGGKMEAHFASLQKWQEGEAKAARPKEEGFFGKYAHAGLESAAATISMLPLTGAKYLLEGMTAVEGIGSFWEAKGKGLNDARAAIYGITQGLIERQTELAGTVGLLRDIAAKTGMFETVKAFVKRDIIGEQYATFWQRLNEKATLTPEMSMKEFIASIPEAQAGTLVSTIVGGGAQVGAMKAISAAGAALTPPEETEGLKIERIQKEIQNAHAFQAEVNHTRLKEVLATVADTPLAKRDSAAFKEFLSSVSEDLTEVYISAATLNEVLTQQGTTLQELQATMPEVAAQLQEGLATNGDVRIAIEDFATYVTTPAMQDALLPHLKTAPEGFTYNQSQEFYQTQVAEMEKQATELADAKAPVMTREEFVAQQAEEVAPEGGLQDFKGLRVREYKDDVRTQAASAFADAPVVLSAVKEVPLKGVELQGAELYDTPEEQTKVAELAAEIAASGEIEPLLVAQRPDGSLYVAEGNHRARALQLLGYDAVPAIVASGELTYEQYIAEQEDVAEVRAVEVKNLRKELVEGIAGMGVFRPEVASALAIPLTNFYIQQAALTRSTLAETRARADIKFAVNQFLQGYSQPSAMATLKDFTREKVGDLLSKHDWAIMTAENPGAGVALSAEENAARNEALKADMDAQGIKYIAVDGGYDRPDEKSFVVLGITREQVAELGAKHGQDAVLTREGLTYRDGTYSRSESVTVHAEAREVTAADLAGDGRDFTAFFEAAARGLRKPDTGKKYTPTIDLSEIQDFVEEYAKHRGNFDDHIAHTIPGFREVQQAVAAAIAKTYSQGGDVLDLGASEGALIKTISSMTEGRVRTLGVDPNVAMAKVFAEQSQVEGAEYSMTALGAKEQEGELAWDESGTPIRFFKPTRLYDVVHEAMVFQFIANKRDAQVRRVKELLKPEGVAIFEEKFLDKADPQWQKNEAQKDAYKAQYFSKTAMEQKKAEVLAGATESDEAKAEQVATGMNDFMGPNADFEAVLKTHFRNVTQFWDSGNFKGYAVSDDAAALQNFTGNLVDMNTKYSERATPSEVQQLPPLQYTRMPDGTRFTVELEMDAEHNLVKRPIDEIEDPAAVLGQKVDQTETEAFKAWFGDSKVVDTNGKPLVVYHGTDAKFDAFDMAKSPDGAHFFVADVSHAASFGENVGEYYVSMQNPLVVSQEDLDAEWDKGHPAGVQDDRSLLPRDFVGVFVARAKEEGHDGVIIRGMGDRDIEADMFLPLEPAQIKSTSSIGTFDPKDPRYLYQGGKLGEVSITGHHFSPVRRVTLDGRFYGTGIQGAESRRLAGSKDSRIKERLHFYVDEGKGVFPEGGVGREEHKVELHNMYDAARNPLRIPASDFNAFESGVIDAGFSGYYIEEGFGRQGVAVLLGEASRGVVPEGGYKRVETAANKATEEGMPALVERYKKLAVQNGVVTIDVDLARELFPDYAASKDTRTRYGVAVHEAASKVARGVYDAALKQGPTEGKLPLVVFLAGGAGSGKSSARAVHGEMFDQAHIIYDGVMSDYDSSKRRIDAALAAGNQVIIQFVSRDPVAAWTEGVLPRAGVNGRIVPLYVHAATHRGAAHNIKRLAQHYEENPSVDVLVIENHGGKDDVKNGSLDSLASVDYNDLEARLYEALDKEFQNGNVTRQIYEAAKTYPRGVQSLQQEADGRGYFQSQDVGAEITRPTFYSALTRAIENHTQKKGSPDQWIGIVKNLTQKGIKADELEFTGVLDWLEEQKTHHDSWQLIEGGLVISQKPATAEAYTPAEGQSTRLLSPSKEITREQLVDYLRDKLIVVNPHVKAGASEEEIDISSSNWETDEPDEYSLRERADENLAQMGEDELRRLLRREDFTYEELEELHAQLTEGNPGEPSEEVAALREKAEELAYELEEQQYWSDGEAPASRYHLVSFGEKEIQISESSFYGVAELYDAEKGVEIPFHGRDAEEAIREYVLENYLDGGGGEATKWSDYQMPGGEEYQERLLINKSHEGERFSYMTHFDEDNVAAFTRSNTRQVPIANIEQTHPELAARLRSEGKTHAKVYFLEEVQSDWAQQGRERGDIQVQYKLEELSVDEASTREAAADRASYTISQREETLEGGTRVFYDVYRKGVVFSFGARTLEEAEGVADKASAVNSWYIKAPDNVYQVAKNRYPTLEAAMKYIVDEKTRTEKGTLTAFEASKRSAELDKQLDEAHSRRRKAAEANDDAAEEIANADLARIRIAQAELPRGQVPYAPFVKSTDSWVALAMKDAIRNAAENDFDIIAWTTGSQQTERWSGGLRKRVSAIKWEKTPEGIHIIALKGSSEVANTKYQETALTSAIGKTMAERIIADPNQSGEISGEDIVVADLGMSYTYGNAEGLNPDGKVAIYPKVANQVLKALGGGKVAGVDLRDPILVARALKYPDSSAYKTNEDEEVAIQPGFEITPKMREMALQGQPLFQPKNLASFDPSTLTVSMLKGANLSSMLHESGHFYLEALGLMSAHPNAAPQLVEDFEKTLAWFGIPDRETWNSMSLEQKRPYHEQWAQSQERWMIEGQAPTLEMQPVFARFRAWMLSVYKSVEQFLRQNPLAGKLNDEMRGVFNRLIASEEAILEAERIRGYASLFPNAEAANMTEKEFSEYMALGEEATQDAITSMQQRSLRDMKWLSNAKNKALRELQKEAAGKRKTIREEVEKEVALERVSQARLFLTKGETTDPATGELVKAEVGHKLNTTLIAEMYPSETRGRGPTNTTSILSNPSYRMEVLASWGRYYGPKRGEAELNDYEAEFEHLQKNGGKVYRVVFVSSVGGVDLSPQSNIHWSTNIYTALDNIDSLPLQSGAKGKERVTGYLLEANIPPGGVTNEGVDLAGNPEEKEVGIARGVEYATRVFDIEDKQIGRERTSEAKPPFARPDLSKLRGMTNKEGLHPDMVAPMFGFTSGDALVRELIEAENVKERIEGLTDQRMLERHGELVDAQAIERAAEAAVHNEARAKFLATGLQILTKSPISASQMTKAAKQAAESTIARKRVRDLRPGQYASAESKANKQAIAQAAKAPAKAAEAQRAALLNNRLAKSATEALTEVEKFLRFATKFTSEGTRQNLDLEYLEQIDDLLAPFDLRRGQTYKAIDKRRTLAEWVEKQEALGFEPILDAALMEEAKRKHYKDMTLEELRGLVDGIKHIEHLGRLKKKLLTAKDNREFAERIREAVESIEANANRTVEERATPADVTGALGRLGRWIAASHRKFSSFMREMDGGKDNGVMWNLLSRGMNEAGDNETRTKAEAAKAVAELFKPVLPKMGGSLGNLHAKRRVVPGTKLSMTYEERVMFAMNWGNEGNRQRLLDGGLSGKRALSEQDAQAVLDTLDKADWDFVQGTWDYINTFKPLIAAQERKLTGKEPAWVDPAPIATKFGTYRGGYFPAKYDAELSTRSEVLEAATNLRLGMKGAFNAAATRNGYTQKRAAEVTGRPLMLNFNAISSHVNEVAHRLAWQEWLTDANRILKALDGTVRDNYGVEVLRELQDTVKDIAAGDAPATTAVEQVINHLRVGSTIVGMGWKVTTALLQPSGLAQSWVRVGGPWVARGLKQYLSNPLKTSALVNERSKLMRDRGMTMQREINEVLNVVRAGGQISAVKASYFTLIAKMQRTVDIPTWLGAYEKAAEQLNLESARDAKTRQAIEENCVALADQAVLDSQSGGQLKDLAKVQRGTPLFKLFTNFYSYFSATYNLNVEAYRRTSFKSPSEVGLLAVDMIMLNTMPVLFSVALKEVMKGGCDNDDMECLANRIFHEQLGFLMGQMIVLREAGAAIDVAFGGAGYGYSGPAGLRFFGDLYKVGQQVGQGEADMALFKAANSTAGTLLHYPAGAVNNFVEGVIAIENGDVEGVSMLPALIAGKPRKEE